MFAPFVLLSSFQSMVALSPSSSKLSSIYCPKKLNALSSIISSERWRLDTTIAAMAKDIGVLVLKVQTGYQSGGYLLILISLSLLQVFSISFFFGWEGGHENFEKGIVSIVRYIWLRFFSVVHGIRSIQLWIVTAPNLNPNEFVFPAFTIEITIFLCCFYECHCLKQ